MIKQKYLSALYRGSSIGLVNRGVLEVGGD